MYEAFYHFREKPFSLLPDAGFLYFSPKHRMALTLLEYGLMNQAGFTVISGDIGTGKTTLIRQLLSTIDPQLTVGLISNTHRTFGELMQWIALAFALPHQGKDKVQLYHDFMAFIIDEYAQGRRTVLIVDEAQNMSAETLEELRMLSNVNADKDQVLQVILVGQRELRDTLRRPDLVQFAQRIGVDYHLEPLTEEETSDYIQHRCRVAGGDPDLFSDQARQAIFRYTGGVPRLVNLLCDTALVYGYAEQRTRIDAALVNEVGRDKQASGLFPGPGATLEAPPQPASKSAVGGATGRVVRPSAPVPGSTTAPTGENHPGANDSAEILTTSAPEGLLRIAIAAESQLLRSYLSRVLNRFGIQVVATLPLAATELRALDQATIDVLLVELDDQSDSLEDETYALFAQWEKPVLFNDSLATETSLLQPNRLEYGRQLSRKLHALALLPPTTA